MTEIVCPVCGKRISNMAMALGNCQFTVEGRMVHNGCIGQKTVHEVAEAIKDGLDKEAGWSVGMPYPPKN